MNVIRSYTEEINKIVLSSDDDKRVFMDDGIHTVACGHTNLKKIVITKISYNEIPNILVDSVVLPNKPLSNFEILMLLKGCHCMDLEGYFCETLFLKKQN